MIRINVLLKGVPSYPICPKRKLGDDPQRNAHLCFWRHGMVLVFVFVNCVKQRNYHRRHWKADGLLRCYVSRVENGHTIPTIETLEKMAALSRSSITLL